jgi:hypothetical protein
MLFPVCRHEKKNRMSISHRVFVVEEDAVFPISQKTFTALYSGKVGALPKFAGQTVQIAVVIYTVQQRKPNTIIQLDCERIRILDDGSIDENYEHKGLHLAANRMCYQRLNRNLPVMLWMRKLDLKKGNGINVILNYQVHLMSEY